MLEGELASWDLCFAITKFCTCRLRPPRRHTSRAAAALCGRSNPLQCSLPSVTARPGHSLRALASQVGPGRGHLPCNPALVSRDGVRAPSGRGGWLALMSGSSNFPYPWSGGMRTRRPCRLRALLPVPGSTGGLAQ